MRAFLLLTGLLALALPGCTLARATLGGPGQGDGGGVDAFVAPIDGAPIDAAQGDDSSVPLDAGSDAGPAPCVPATETCNLFDDDCDGMADEEGCGCEMRERDGHVYQLCPAASINQAWGRCTTLGPGYDLVVLGDGDEASWMRAWTSHEWVSLGLQDFATDGTWVWADGTSDTTGLFAIGEGTGGTGENCAVMSNEGARDIGCYATQRFLCEGARRGAPLPAGTSESCNGRDDDLDGPIDEGACDCETLVFDHHVYQHCTESRSWSAARTDCRDEGDYTLISIDHRGESDALAQVRGGDGWTGLNDDASEDDFVWERDPGVPISSGNSAQGGHFVRWVGVEPNDAGGSHHENWVMADGAGNWYDVASDRSYAYLCERAIEPL